MKKFSIFLLICFGYFFSRFQNLTSIPVFGDEAIYIRWSQIIRSVETLRFIPVTDGKQPLFMWIVASILKFFSDPLFSGRLISILSGFGIILGLFLTSVVALNFSSKLKNPIHFIFESIKTNSNIGLISIFIYTLLPFSFFFDRLALPDNLLSFFGIWSFFFSLLLSKFKRLDLSLILGIILGLAWLTKSPAIYFIFLSLGTFVFLNFKNLRSTIYDLRSIFLPLISAFISFCIYNILRLGPQFHMIALRNKDYIWPFSEILKHPLDPLTPHISDIFTIYSQYISWPVLLVAFLGFVLLFLKKIKFNNYQILFIVICWWILPLITNATIAKVFTARYILFTLPPLIILISISFNFLLNSNFWFLFLTPLIFLFNLVWIYKISIQPQKVTLPSTETGYLENWTSGWGIKQAAEFLKNRSLSANIIVGTEGSFGTLPDGLQIYTENIPHLTVFGVGLGFSKIPEKLIDAKNHGDEVYILINQSRNSLIIDEKLKLDTIMEISKPGNDSLILYRLK